MALALIIEDDEQQAPIFAQALKMADFETETIHDGKTALERLSVIVPDLVVLDMHLPYVSGDTILRHIRADERLTNTRVMVATANAHMAESLRNESDLILLKPVSFAQLRDLAKRLHPSDTLDFPK